MDPHTHTHTQTHVHGSRPIRTSMDPHTHIRGFTDSHLWACDHTHTHGPSNTHTLTYEQTLIDWSTHTHTHTHGCTTILMWSSKIPKFKFLKKTTVFLNNGPNALKEKDAAIWPIRRLTWWPLIGRWPVRSWSIRFLLEKKKNKSTTRSPFWVFLATVRCESSDWLLARANQKAFIGARRFRIPTLVDYVSFFWF